MGSKSFSAYAMCGLLCHDVTILYSTIRENFPVGPIALIFSI